jgi:hypothetical protein
MKALRDRAAKAKQAVQNRFRSQKPLETNTLDATCLPGTGESTTFEQYVKRCRTAQDQQRANNFFSESIAQYKESFEQLRAQYDDLIVSGDSMNSLLSLSGGTVSAANNQINQLTKKKDMLKAEKDSIERQSQAADKSFLEEVMHGTPKPELAPGLDDIVLLLFWVSWLILGIALISVRTFSPMGGWRSALFSLTLLLLITVCLYGVLKQVA